MKLEREREVVYSLSMRGESGSSPNSTRVFDSGTITPERKRRKSAALRRRKLEEVATKLTRRPSWRETWSQLHPLKLLSLETPKREDGSVPRYSRSSDDEVISEDCSRRDQSEHDRQRSIRNWQIDEKNTPPPEGNSRTGGKAFAPRGFKGSPVIEIVASSIERSGEELKRDDELMISSERCS